MEVSQAASFTLIFARALCADVTLAPSLEKVACYCLCQTYGKDMSCHLQSCQQAR